MVTALPISHLGSADVLLLLSDQKLLNGISPYVALAWSHSELTALFSPTAKNIRQFVGRRLYMVQWTDRPISPLKAWQRIGLFSVPLMAHRVPSNLKIK